jgi:ABC-type transport system involved in multi-copper enzyme maturation permease subunit
MLISVFLMTIFGLLLFLGLIAVVALFNPGFVWRDFWDNTPGIGSLIEQGVMFMVGGAANLSQWLSRMPLVAQNAAVVAFGCFTLLSGLTAFGMLLLAAWNVRRCWREEPPSARMKEFEKAFLKPVVWVGFFKRWMQRKLDKNPIGWLEQRRWTGRMVSLAWFTVVVVVYSMVLGDRNFMRNSGDMQSLLAWLLVATIAATSAASFRRERENGVLELLLVSPLKAREIVQGRLRGLWGQFLPACATMLVIWVYMIGLFGRSYGMGGGSLTKVWFFAVTFATIPVVGLYFSLLCRHFISAYLLTLAVAVVVPVLLVGIACKWVATPESIYNEYGEMWRGIYVGTQFVQGGIVLLLLPRLTRKLNERSFPMERTI